MHYPKLERRVSQVDRREASSMCQTFLGRYQAPFRKHLCDPDGFLVAADANSKELENG
jgi:hypothetical protein